MELNAADVERFLTVDATNGAPRYLEARLLLEAGKTAEGLAAFREGLAQGKFTVYDTPEYRLGMISALDLLGVTGEARVAALVKAIEARLDPHGDSVYISFVLLSKKLREAATKMPAQERETLVEEMTRFSGKLMGENNGLSDEGLYCAYAVLSDAWNIKAEGEGDKDAKRALVIGAGAVRSPWWKDSASSNFVSALSIACREPLAPEQKLFYDNLPAAEKPRVDGAFAAQQEVSRSLMTLLAADPDKIVERGVIHDVFTAFHGVEHEHGEIAKASRQVLAAKEAALEALMAPSGAMRSKETLKKLGLSFLMYASDHDDTLPPDLATLKSEGYVVNGAAVNSPATGRPYVYVAPGMSLRDRNQGATAILYDDNELDGDKRLVLFADGHIVPFPKAMLDDMLQKQQK